MPRKTKHPGLRAHSWRTSGGEVRTAYYLDNRGGKHQPGGPEEIPLGTDHAEAVRQWTALVLLKPLDIPAELRPGLDALDRHIAGIAEVYREAVAATLGPFSPAELVLMNEASRLGKIAITA